MGRTAKNFTPLTETQRELASTWYAYAFKVAISRAAHRYDMDDVRSTAHMCLVRAARRWVDDGRSQFKSYLFRSVWLAMTKLNTDPHQSLCDLNENTLSIASKSDRSYDDREYVAYIRSTLSDHRQTIIKMFYDDGMTVRQIAKKLKCSVWNVYRVRNDALSEIARKSRWEAYPTRPLPRESQETA